MRHNDKRQAWTVGWFLSAVIYSNDIPELGHFVVLFSLDMLPTTQVTYLSFVALLFCCFVGFRSAANNSSDIPELRHFVLLFGFGLLPTIPHT